MKYRRLHHWNVTPHEAILIQKSLAKKIALKENLTVITKIAACDVGFVYNTNKMVAAIVVLNFPQLELIEEIVRIGNTNFPYIPGLLTFREGPMLLKAFSALKNHPDIAIFDGQGIAHPRKMGLATHMGILIDIPTIGCAKTLLSGAVEQPANFKGAYSYLRDKKGEIIGAAVRTRKDVRCVFVSPGYKISLKRAKEIILTCSPRFRIPQPLRLAHSLTQIHKPS
jgi:deoxyribonuclease V